MTDKTLSPAPDAFPYAAGTFALPGPAGQIELAVDLAEPDLARAGVAVLCHPHPQHGGNLHNKVVTMLERALRESGLDTVRFNFRGVGGSAGEYDEGRGETADLSAVVAWMRKLCPKQAIWLAGFSFGSFVALRSAQALNADVLITVAPPVGRWEFSDIETPSCPWLLIQGEDDEVVDAQAVFAWAKKLDPTPNVVRMPETGHYFHRRLMDLRGVVKNGVRNWLPELR